MCRYRLSEAYHMSFFIFKQSSFMHLLSNICIDISLEIWKDKTFETCDYICITCIHLCVFMYTV